MALGAVTMVGQIMIWAKVQRTASRAGLGMQSWHIRLGKQESSMGAEIRTTFLVGGF